MAITRIRAEQQVSQSSITETQLSGSVAGDGLLGGDGTALAVSSSHNSIVITPNGLSLHQVVSSSDQIVLEDITSQSNATDYIKEGNTNLYYTDARVATKNLGTTYVSQSPQIVLHEVTSQSNATDYIAEGNTNLYYTDDRVATKNLSFDYVSESAQITLGNLSGLPTTSPGLVSQSSQIQLHNGVISSSNATDHITEGNTNLYYTAARVKTKIDEELVVSRSDQVKLEDITSQSNATDYIKEGNTNLYYTDTRVLSELHQQNVISASTQISMSGLVSSSDATTYISEGTNLYYTDARVLAELHQQNVFSGSDQITGSNIDPIFGDITATNISASAVISASSYYGEFIEISSSIEFSSGSTIFGDDSGDSHEFTGSVDVEGSLTISGAVSLEDNVTLGGATTDDITFTGRAATAIIPKANNTQDLGLTGGTGTGRAWKDLFVSGTAYIQELSASGFTIGRDSGGGNSGKFNIISSSLLEIGETAFIANTHISGGKVDNTNIGSITPNSGSFTGIDVDVIDSTTAHLGTTMITAATMSTAKVTDLTNGRLVIAGQNGELHDDNGLTYDTDYDSLSATNITSSNHISASDINFTTGSIDAHINIGKKTNKDGKEHTTTYSGFFGEIFDNNTTLGYAINQISDTFNLLTPATAPLLQTFSSFTLNGTGDSYSTVKLSKNLPHNNWGTYGTGNVTLHTGTTVNSTLQSTGDNDGAGASPLNDMHLGLYNDWKGKGVDLNGHITLKFLEGSTERDLKLNINNIQTNDTSETTSSGYVSINGTLALTSITGFGGSVSQFWFKGDPAVSFTLPGSYTGSLSASLNADFGGHSEKISTKFYKVTTTETNKAGSVVGSGNMTINNPVYSWLSGHRAYTDGTEFTASLTAKDLFNPAYKDTIANLPEGGNSANTFFNHTMDKTVSDSEISYLSGNSNAPNYNDIMYVSYSTAVDTQDSNVTTPTTLSSSAVSQTMTLYSWAGTAKNATEIFTFGSYPIHGVGALGNADMTTQERFHDETYRRKMLGSGVDITRFNLTAFDSSASLAYTDLQQKPGPTYGWLVHPTSNNSNQKGWYQPGGPSMTGSPGGVSGLYTSGSYYVRELDTDGKPQHNRVKLTIKFYSSVNDLSSILVPFDDNTANKLSIGLLLKRVADNDHTGILKSQYGQDIIFDGAYADPQDNTRNHKLPYGSTSLRTMKLWGSQYNITTNNSSTHELEFSFPSTYNAFVGGGGGNDTVLIVRYTSGGNFKAIKELKMEYL